MRTWFIASAIVLCGLGASASGQGTPPAAAESYSVQNGELVVAPGLHIPNGNVPWALDVVDGKQVLVPVHGTSVDPAGKLEFGNSRTTLRDERPVLFVHALERTDNTGDAGRRMATGWVLVSIVAADDSRTVPTVQFSDANPSSVCAAPRVCLVAQDLPDGWLRLTAGAAIPAGEYALLPVKRNAGEKLAVVYDFRVGVASVPRDAVQPGQPIKPVTVKH